jgi:hypothetical protein
VFGWTRPRQFLFTLHFRVLAKLKSLPLTKRQAIGAACEKEQPASLSRAPDFSNSGFAEENHRARALGEILQNSCCV